MFQKNRRGIKKREYNTHHWFDQLITDLKYFQEKKIKKKRFNINSQTVAGNETEENIAEHS